MRRALAMVVLAAVIVPGLAVTTVTVPARAAGGCLPSVSSPTVSIDTSPVSLGGTVAFHGAGWCHPTGGGSTIGVKLDAGDYNRPDTAVSSSKSVWAIVQADPETGDFSGSFTLPDGTAATSSPALTEGSHALTFLSGSLKTGDTVRSLTAAFAVGRGNADGGGGGSSATTCVPTSSTPTVALGSTTAELGGILHVTGAGFCNPAGGGSVIGVKLDDGTYSRVGGTNTWMKIEANDADGTFSVELTLPDGTAATSDPAFPRGQHTLRLLTGSLAAGDTVRTVKSEPFVIGAYRPSDLPDPLAPSTLAKGDRHGVEAVIGAKKIKVTVPGRPAGTWVFVTLYDDGSPRYPWSSWRRLDAQHQVRLSRRAVTSAGVTGRVRLVVQSGDEGESGALLGWTRVRLPAVPTTTTSSSGNATTSSSGTVTSSAPPAAPVAPPALAAPYGSFADLDPKAHGAVRASVSGRVVTLRARAALPGDLVFVHVYTASATTPVGWARLDAKRRTSIDLGAFIGYAGLTVQSASGRLLGWAPVRLGTVAPVATETAAVAGASAPAPVARTVATTPREAGVSWLSGLDGLLLALGALVLAAASVVTGRPRRAGASA